MLYLRSLLFIPGNQPKMLNKAPNVFPDAFIPDLEDSVAWDNKDDARNIVHNHLDMLSQTSKLLIPRVNALETGILKEDLQAVINQNVFAIAIGKIYSSKDVQEISNLISKAEKEKKIKEGSIKLILWMETAQAIINAYEILTSNKRIVGSAFGAEDFTNDMGIHRTENENEIFFARNQLSVASRAANVIALDTPFFAFKDPDALKENSLFAKSIGFKGKFAIHPDQIDIINDCFSPSIQEIDHANKVIKTFEEAKKQGRGSTSLDGLVIDVPVVKRAESLLNISKEMGII